MAVPPLYRLWKHMRSRCNNPNNPRYSDYGGRGITVCDRWRLFKNFVEDMGDRPSMQHTLERRDNDRGYFPNNCYWATKLEQANNKRNNNFVTFKNETMTLPRWADYLGIKCSTLTQRYYSYGWSIEKTLTTQVRNRRVSN